MDINICLMETDQISIWNVALTQQQFASYMDTDLTEMKMD